MRSVDNINKSFIFIIVLVFWVGYDLYSGLRLADIFMVIAALFYIFFLAKVSWTPNLFWVVAIFFALLISIVNLTMGHWPTLLGLFLSLKVGLLVLFSMFVSKEVQRFDIKLIEKLFLLLIVIFFGLCFSSIFHVLTYTVDDKIHHPRPSFPFSRELDLSDAHVLGSYLALSVVFFMKSISKNFIHLRFASILVGIIGFVAMLATGSRTTFLVIFSWICLELVRGILQIKHREIFLMILFALFLPLLAMHLPDVLKEMGERVLSFDIGKVSEARRLERLSAVFIESADYFYLLGRGLLFSDQLYFDSIVTFLLSNLGIVGVLVYFGLIINYAIKYISKGKLSYLLLTLSLISLVATEYFLISRWFIPTLFYFLLAKWLEDIDAGTQEVTSQPKLLSF